ncbi:glycosyltransferase family 4 protein [Mucilaginibacter sp. SMC90]|uniref:glycosyltransferase family 4 protein n=1 Tax=Mucilaginibacter sp. SMC90 TaxID=2929803 RepID=UPI001FB2F6AA|nr:glycosyltransferase family 4 protein [Mucilaginibacter sp. SMC90]UOE51887.1 glycosyltransferase family 4 protein [Mucilaginibacter sp. SMC90]
MAQSLKVLLITHKFYPDLGGTEANAEFLAKAFHNYGAQVHLLTWTQQSGTKVFPYQVVRNPGLKQLLAEHKWADVVFENSPVLRMSWPAVFFRKPLIVSLNTWLSNEDGSQSVQAKMKYLWLRKASSVIAVSDAIRQKCWPAAVVIENAYNDELFVQTVTSDEKPKSFVFLGRLVSDKGADLAIEAIAQLHKEYREANIDTSEITLTVIGEGKDFEKLKRYVIDAGIKQIVRFEGSLTGEKLVDNLNQHRYMLIPSRWQEPFGIVALEGLACGCIPIVSDGGGLPDAVGKAGLVFKRGDLPDLVNTIKRLLNDKLLQKKLRHEADAHLKAHTSKVVARQYFDIINPVGQ